MRDDVIGDGFARRDDHPSAFRTLASEALLDEDRPPEFLPSSGALPLAPVLCVGAVAVARNRIARLIAYTGNEGGDGWSERPHGKSPA
jgi:hypothetical protein